MDPLYLFSKYIAIPFYDHRYGIHNKKAKKAIRDSQYWTEDQLRAYQLQKIKQLLEYVHNHNKFYFRKFSEAGINPNEIDDLSDFEKMPCLTKEEIRSNLKEMVSDTYNVNDLIMQRTGGSTGEPVRVYWDYEARSFKMALVERHDAMAGFYPGLKKAALWGNTNRQLSLKEKIYQTFYQRVIYLDTLNMNDENIQNFLSQVKSFKPKIMFGHAHSLYFLGKYIIDNTIDIRMKSIISSAEVLSSEERIVIEQAFKCKVFDRYGCEELSIIASECEYHDGLHIASEGLYVEVDSDSDNVPGDLIITDLVNYAMPLIRYKIGDMATIKRGKCQCGRGLPKLDKVIGRVSDVIVTPDGRKISGISILDTFIIHIPGFKRMQIIQEKKDLLRFKVIRDSNFKNEDVDQLKNEIKKIFGKEMLSNIEFVDNIPLTNRGKFQFTINKYLSKK